MKFKIYSNGKEVKDKILAERLSSREVSVFESLRTYKGKIFRLEDHLDRFLESAKTVGVKGLRKDKLRREIHTAVKKAKSRGKVSRYQVPADLFIRLTLFHDQIFVMMGSRQHPKSLFEKGVALKTSPVRRSLSNAAPPEVKTSAYQNAAFASLEPSPKGVYEWLFLDVHGFVTEVRVGNFFIVTSLGLLTPPLQGILNGVTRRFVIECALRNGIKVKEVPFSRHDVFNAKEAFLTNTSWEILPVRELDFRRIGKAIPGPVTLKLQKKFKAQVRRELK